jgi:KaiC/GvpD/RAD55 family RecA-like ATPase
VQSFKENPMANKTTTEHLQIEAAVLFWQNVQRLRRRCLGNQPRRSVRVEAMKKTSHDENKEDEAVC